MRSGKRKLNARDHAILAHVARYRLTLQEIVSALFFGGREPQKALSNLCADGYLQVRTGFGGNRRAYVLAPPPTDAPGAPVGQKASPGDSGNPGTELDGVNLAILGFCFLNGTSRIRLKKVELSELFSNQLPPRAYHCLEHTRHAKRVYRIYVPGPGTPPKDAADLTAEHVGRALGIPWLRPWLDNDVYSYAILVDTPEREAEVKAAVDEAKVKNQGRLRQLAHVHVEVVPGLPTIEEALRALAQKG